MLINYVLSGAGVESVTPFQTREITHVFHDVDGTHSLIREWIPVMALATGWVAKYGLPTGSEEEACEQILLARAEDFPESHRFSIESAGMSALTQMEWAIRSGVENKVIKAEAVDFAVNAKIIELIWAGHEVFDDYEEAAVYKEFVAKEAAALFRTYERLLGLMSRNKNLSEAKINPDKWRVSGSMEFLQFLRDSDVRSYFITGAVVESDQEGKPTGTMYEEICTLGYEIGKESLVQQLHGSTWNEKIPKLVIMRNICKKEEINPENVLIVGDGRSEIAAGAELGAVTMSRLDVEAKRPREIHRQLKTNFIVDHYNLPELKKLFADSSR